jgi:hypothetical protein
MDPANPLAAGGVFLFVEGRLLAMQRQVGLDAERAFVSLSSCSVPGYPRA